MFAASKNRIAIFGGSFNPPHLGHMMAMLWLREALGYTNIHMVPVHCHNFGKELVDFKHRVSMCNILAAKVKGVKVNTIEKELSHPNTTFGLLDWYDRKYTYKLFSNEPYRFDLVIGSDIVPQLTSWHNWHVLKSLLSKVIVLERPGYDTFDQIPEDRTGIVISHQFDYYSVGITSISSTEIRELIKSNGKIKHLVGKEVADYINKHRLYLK